jgi:hypothetical protein
MCAHHVRSYGRWVPTDRPTTDPRPASSGARRTDVPQYEIRVQGHLGSRWVAWFDGLELTTEPDGTTVLRGPVVDQSSLHGLLQKLRDLAIPLVSLTRLPSAEPAEGPDVRTQPSHHNPSGATS